MQLSKPALKRLGKVWAYLGPVLASIVTLIVTNWVQDRSPEIIVRQFYNSIDPQKAVPKQVGGLTIDYQPANLQPHSDYVVQVMNAGRGPEEDVRLHVRFPAGIAVNQYDESALRVYLPEGANFDGSSFFVNLKQFPQNAFAPVIFSVKENTSQLCAVKIQVAGRQKEGRVDGLKGMECASF